jgi:hypothetical protein
MSVYRQRAQSVLGRVLPNRDCSGCTGRCAPRRRRPGSTRRRRPGSKLDELAFVGQPSLSARLDAERARCFLCDVGVERCWSAACSDAQPAPDPYRWDARGELIVGAQSSGSQPNVVAAQAAEGPHGVGLVATGCPCCDELERENGREQPKGLMHNGGRRSLGSVVRPRRGYCNPSPERMGSNSHDVDQLAQAAKVNGVAGIQARRVGMGGGRYQ